MSPLRTRWPATCDSLIDLELNFRSAQQRAWRRATLWAALDGETPCCTAALARLGHNLRMVLGAGLGASATRQEATQRIVGAPGMADS